jgi:hypothetical protein
MQVLYSTDNPSSSARLCRVQVGARLGQFETRKTVEEAIRMEATVFTGRGGLVLSCRGGGWDGKSSSFYGHLKLGPSSL